MWVGEPAVREKWKTLLFLHGAAYSSATWKDLGTLSFFCDRGYRYRLLDERLILKILSYFLHFLFSSSSSSSSSSLSLCRVVAVDLPSRPETVFYGTREHFLSSLFAHPLLSSAVVVAPSMSASYAFPFFESLAKKGALQYTITAFIAGSHTYTHTHTDTQTQALTSFICSYELDGPPLSFAFFSSLLFSSLLALSDASPLSFPCLGFQVRLFPSPVCCRPHAVGVR
jgi:hypothetical protein